MPTVKTISPGRLTGISGLTTEAARGVKFNKDTEYAYKLEEWKAQNDRIAEVEKEEQDEIRENLKLIAGQDLGEGGFNESVRNQMMDLAVKTARANSKMKLGDLDVMDGAKEVANVVQIVNEMNSPDKNSNVEYSVVNGKSMIKHKQTGQEISLQGLNDIMSGENAKYPIKFIETDFTAAAEQPMKNMLKENAKNYTKQVSDTVYDADGTKREVIKNVTYTGEGSNYKTDLTALVNVMLDDQKSMPSYWANITGNKEPWVNSQKQRDEAFELMYDKTDKAWGPKVRSETTSETTVEAKPSSGNENDDGSSSEETKKFNFYDELDQVNEFDKDGNIDKEATVEKIKSILIDANPGVVVKASNSALNDEIDRSLPGYNENDLYIKVTPSGSKNQPPYQPLSLDILDRYIGIGDRNNFIDVDKINDFMITTLQSYQGPSSGAAKFNPKK